MSRTRLVAKPQMLGLAFVLGLWGLLSLPSPLGGQACRKLPVDSNNHYHFYYFYFLLFIYSFFPPCLSLYLLLSLFPCGALAHVRSDGARGAEARSGWYLGEMGLDRL